MKSSKVQTLCVCGCCKRSLPASAFYINKKTGLPGNYCKECRKTVSRNHRKNEKRSLACDRESSYPVITSTEDPTLRRELILHALETVALNGKGGKSVNRNLNTNQVLNLNPDQSLNWNWN